MQGKQARSRIVRNVHAYNACDTKAERERERERESPTDAERHSKRE